MTVHEENQLTDIIGAFVGDILHDRYEVFVSSNFLIALLVRQCAPKAKQILSGDCNEAYHAACPIFESILEHKCHAGGNGHHIAQNFQTFFEQQLNPDEA